LLKDSVEPRATSLGLSLWRTSLGLGRKLVGEKPIAYYVNSEHAESDQPLRKSDVGVLRSGWLDQNERLREDVYGAVIYATFAALLIFALGIGGPALFRPASRTMAIWPILCVVFLWRAISHLRTATASATDLCALESCLWQYAIYGPDQRPKRLLVTQAGPIGKLARRLELLALSAVVAGSACLVLVGFTSLWQSGRWYAVPYTHAWLPQGFALTKDNVGTVVDLESVFRVTPPELRSSDQLIGTIVSSGCNGSADPGGAAFGDVAVLNPERHGQSFDPCQPVLTGKPDDTVTLDVKLPPADQIGPLALVLPPPTVSYDPHGSMPKLPELQVAPPAITYVGGMPTLDPLVVGEPKIKYDPDQPKSALDPVTLAQPKIQYDPAKTAALDPLTVAPPTIKYDPDTATMPELKVTASTLAIDAGRITAAGDSDTGGDSDCTDANTTTASNETQNGAVQQTSAGPDGAKKDCFHPQQSPRGTQWTSLSAPPSRGVSLWFQANCPQSSAENATQQPSRQCADADTDGLNGALNGNLKVSPAIIGQFLGKLPKNVRFVLIGHADTPGDTDFNVSLSEKRIAYARKLIVAAGFKDFQVRSFAAGGDFPWVPQSGSQHKLTEIEEPQQLNRRVDIYVFGN
jgi:outer membrane protein OmpA-like peptidoglycan-associated protein